MEIIAETEQALVGSIITAPDKLVHVVDTVRPDDFTDPVAKRAYLVALGLWQERKTVDLVSVASADVSLAAYVAEATSKGAGIAAKDYARQVATQAKERRLAADLNGILNSREPIDLRLDSILALYQREMFVSSKAPDMQSVLRRFNEHVASNRKRRSMGIPTGFGFLEEAYIQYVPGHIWTMGAYTSVGKTAVMIQKLCNLIAMDADPSITVISTEMTEQQLIARILANFTGVHSQRILSGNFRQGEEEIVGQYMGLLRSKRVRIHDDVYALGDIETVFRKADLQGGVDIGFIDYVQNCQVPEAKSEYQVGSMLAKRLQKMAKDVTCCLVCLSQVSNDVGRGNTEQLEYKGAGEWAAVSDVGIHLQRHKTEKHRLKYSVKKNRHGALLDQELEYKAEYTRLEVI